MNGKELKKRQEKAAGLKAYRLEDNLYAVEASDGDRFYKVLNDGERMLCACADFTRHGGEDGWRCKHILAVEQSLEDCPESATSHSSRQCNGLNRKLLETPFESSQIRQRKGAFGDVLDYVEGHTVIRRLNDAFDARWNFEILDYKIMDEEVVVLGRLKAGDTISKMQFGSSRITRSKEDNSRVGIGNDLKAAATDALKKAATHFGVGLHLYEEKNATEFPFGENTDSEEEKKPQDNHRLQRLTNRQLTTIYSIAKEKGIGSKEVEQRIFSTFNKRPEYLSKQEASDVIKQLMEHEAEVASGVKEREEGYESQRS